jgi:hypothetical protein
LKSPRLGAVVCGLLVVAAAVALLMTAGRRPPPAEAELRVYEPAKPLDTFAFIQMIRNPARWPAGASPEELAAAWPGLSARNLAAIDALLADPPPEYSKPELFLAKVGALHAAGESDRAYQVLEEARAWVEAVDVRAEEWLMTILCYQGLAALRCGEDDNCVLCRGESSCILPLSLSAIHTRPRGSRLAIRHFTDYLRHYPDHLEVRWVLNLAHMTLGEHPQGVDPRHLLTLKGYIPSEKSIGRFRDIGHLVGVNRFNQAGGAILDDFDNDGLLDLVVSTMDPAGTMAFYRNRGDGTFEDRTRASGLGKQFGGLYCVQADYNNDGHLDVFLCRGAWVPLAQSPSLLRNNGDGTFTDVTKEAGLALPVNSISACWADYDNDGWLDLFVCCESQRNLLYRNKGDGTFEEVAVQAGLAGSGKMCKGAAWIDFDNDGFPDLFVNNLGGTAKLYRNNRDGTFSDVTREMGIDGPEQGFSCWAFDFDNDGWLDLFATSYDRSLGDVVRGLLGQPHQRHTCKLYRNRGGKGFQDVTRQAGLDKVYATMGSNFADLDNDGWLDFYLGTGDPGLGMLVPNRMFLNVGGKRFAEITASSGTGHLQKGHAVACGDWDRDGNVDVFIQMGGAVNGDRYHNVLFQNPGGHGNSWLNVKLVGTRTNRSAIGARIKVVTAGKSPLTVHRHVSSGSSFGANPLEQHVGLGKADRVALLEVHWPTSGTTQVFRDLAVNQAIEIRELAGGYRKREWKRLPVPANP